jgi:hypothetical protein
MLLIGIAWLQPSQPVRQVVLDFALASSELRQAVEERVEHELATRPRWVRDTLGERPDRSPDARDAGTAPAHAIARYRVSRRTAAQQTARHDQLAGGSNPRGTIGSMTTREKLESLLDRLSEAELEAEYRRLREAVEGEPEMAALPAGWGQTLTGERMPNVVAAVRRSRESH